MQSTNSETTHKMSLEGWQRLKDSEHFPLLLRLLGSLRWRVTEGALLSSGTRDEQLAHFHEAKGARAILTHLMTGILDKEARDLLGDEDLQELYHLEDYMPVTHWDGQEVEESARG